MVPVKIVAHILEHKKMAKNVILTNVMRDRNFLKMENVNIVQPILRQAKMVNNVLR